MKATVAFLWEGNDFADIFPALMFSCVFKKKYYYIIIFAEL